MGPGNSQRGSNTEPGIEGTRVIPRGELEMGSWLETPASSRWGGRPHIGEFVPR
jgi:hypothetical protein